MVNKTLAWTGTLLALAAAVAVTVAPLARPAAAMKGKGGGKGGKGKGSKAPTPSPSWFACEEDADCVSIKDPSCCPCGNVAVNEGQVAAYTKANNCTRSDVMCPMIYCPPDQRVPLCTYVGKSMILQCQLKNVDEIPCNGFTRPSHACPAGYRCQLPPGTADIPGKCVKDVPCKTDKDCPNYLFTCDSANDYCVFNPARITNSTVSCGGITGKPCPSVVGSKPLQCVDDPRDNCDPASGGADCGGLCVPANQPPLGPVSYTHLTLPTIA